MDNKLFRDELSYHYSDGKLSLWVNRERKNFKGCKSPVTRLRLLMHRLEDSVIRIYFSTQIYSVFTEARHLLLLLLDLVDYLHSRVSVSGWTLVLPLLFHSESPVTCVFQLFMWQITRTMESALWQMQPCWHLQVQTYFQFSMLKGISSEP